MSPSAPSPSFFQQLRQRQVFKVGAAYAITGWLLIQIVNDVFPLLDLPRWTGQFVVVLILLGFPLTLVLAWVFELTPEGIRATDSVQSPPEVAAVQGRKLNQVIMGLLAVSVLFLMFDRFAMNAVDAAPRAPAPMAAVSGVQRVSLVLPPDISMPVRSWPSRSFALAPDGNTVAFVGPSTNADTRRFMLHVRTLESRAVRTLPDTENAVQPFFSPDGQWLAFFTNFTNGGELKKVPLDGGRPVTLTNMLKASTWDFGAWLEDDSIVFSDSGSLQHIGADGSGLRELASPDYANGETGLSFPVALPGQNRVLVSVFTNATQVAVHVEVVDLATLKRQPVLENAKAIQVLASGHLLFERDGGTLLAPFDATSLRLTGPATPLPEAIAYDNTVQRFPNPEVAVSAAGTLAYIPADSFIGSELGFLQPGGEFEALKLPANSYRQPRVAPDGRTLSYLAGEGEHSDLYRYDLERGTTSRLSQDGAYIEAASWRPDGLGMAVANQQQGIVLMDNAGTRLLVAKPDGEAVRNMVWTPDGTALIYTRQKGEAHDLWLHRLDGSEPDRVIAASAEREHDPALSPDGRWLAYTSTASGFFEILVQAFPDGVPQTVSVGGGFAPLWSADGSALYFVGDFAADEAKFMRVAVAASATGLDLGRPEVQFALEQSGPGGTRHVYLPGTNGYGSGFDVMPDGRFVLARSTVLERREIVLVQNWFDAARTLAPVPAP